MESSLPADEHYRAMLVQVIRFRVQFGINLHECNFAF